MPYPAFNSQPSWLVSMLRAKIGFALPVFCLRKQIMQNELLLFMGIQV
ncbi:hypothetical protein L910_0890 [Vibrio fluvialis PG41]|uniref:Uncharacterized protein n=1 Tax=Vibrio fluvialis PG41 TaxID=1336752 RepID=S7I3A8_VIBFL|nr:hypothetical protein L910_0890 [Vibrio fluvialis PG41]